MAYISVAGAIGGIVNALLTNNGFVFPSFAKSGNKKTLKPGVFGNVLIGASAALVSWGLYTSPSISASAPILCTNEPIYHLPLPALVGAFLVGIGGARFLTTELDKRSGSDTGPQIRSTD